jgi:hypothetical protein
MSTLAETIKKLAAKAGIDTANEEFKIAIDVISQIKEDFIPENTDLLGAYILKSDAKVDPEIKSHYYGQFANQFDSAVLKSYEAIGLSKDALEDLKKNEPNSFKRLDQLTIKAQEHIAKLADPSTLKGEKADLQKKLDELDGQIKSMLDVHETEKRQLNERNEQREIDFYLKDVSRDFKLIDIPYRDTIVGQSIKKALEEHEVKPILKDGKVTLVNAKDPLLNAKDGLTFKSIIEKGFANDKLLDLGTPPTPEGDELRKRGQYQEPSQQETVFQRNLRMAKASATSIEA